MSFDSLGLHPNILKGIHELGFSNPTPVQEEAIPQILKGGDVIVSAQTGTGKTAAFVLPTLHRLLSTPRQKPGPGPRALFVAPTRELALQSLQHLEDLSRHVPLRGVAIFGGVQMYPQTKALTEGVDIISATPGRLLDHVYEGRIDFGVLEVFVLDEADRMMDMGFLPDVRKIISLLPPKRQSLIVSATIPADILKLSREFTKDPVTVQIGLRTDTAKGIRHSVYPVAHGQKAELLVKLLLTRETDMESVIVFTRTKIGADKLFRSLERARIRTALIHGDRSQDQRNRALEFFKQGECQVLVATDVAARGIDVKGVSHVVNYDVPQAPEDYIHRSGRTARAERTGDSFTFMAPDERELVEDIERITKLELPRVTLAGFNYRPDAPGGHGSHGGGSRGGSSRGGGHRSPGGGQGSHGRGRR